MSYEVQLSEDSQTWTPIYRTTKGGGGLDNLDGLAGKGRYVRLVRPTAAVLVISFPNSKFIQK